MTDQPRYYALPYFVNRPGTRSVDAYCRCNLHSEYSWDTIQTIFASENAGTLKVDSMLCPQCGFDWRTEEDRLKRITSPPAAV
jgi:hypothetical protein